MYETKLLCALPEEWCTTPDGMAIDREGNLVLSCPNFAEGGLSGTVLRIARDTKKVTKWFDVPVHPETGVARNMGIEFDRDYNLYLCDNQGWSEKPDVLYKGRVLRLAVEGDGTIRECRVVARNMEHPNGLRIRGDYMYVTQSYMHPATKDGEKLVSGVYRFGLDERDVEITNTRDDKHLFAAFQTENGDCQYGMDGIALDKEGNLFAGNFGDGEIYRLVLDEKGDLVSCRPFAKNKGELRTTDGMCFDGEGRMYIADFSENALCRMLPDGTLERVAQSPDSDGLHGELDQPGEPICWDGKIVASCFDLVTGPDKVNTAHELPATLCYFEL